MRRQEASYTSRTKKEDSSEDTDEVGELEEEFEDESEEEPEEEDPEMDPEEDPDMDSEEEPEEESCNEPDEKLPQEPSEADNCPSVVGSKERKRLLDATETNSDPLKSQKKFRHDKAFETEAKSATAKNGESAAKQQETTGKRRRSRWDPQPEPDAKISEGDDTIKRRKTRWSSDTPQSNMLGPVQIPDFGIISAGSEFDPEVEKLKLELLEVKTKLLSSELEDDRPKGERSPSPPPEYNNLGMRTNSRQVKLRQKLINRRQHIISELLKKNPIFKAYETPKLVKKIYIPVEEFPSYNFVGLIMGPRGNTHKQMEKETGAKIHLRGRGSSKAPEKKDDTSSGENLHVFIEANSQRSLDAAVAMVEKLLIPVDEQMNHHKRVQLEELAKLNGTYNLCRVCKEQGHKHYACPNQKSTFDAVKACTSCGSFSHVASTCPLIASKEVNDRSLYVGYLPQAVDESRLRELFCPFGKIVEVKVIKDRNTSVTKGYGFVNFETSSDAAMAVTHMNGHPMEGKMLAVRVAGRPPQGPQVPTSLPSMAYLPKYPGFASISADTQSQAAWPGPPGSTLPDVQAPLGHCNQLPGSNATGIFPSVVSSHPNSQGGRSFDSLYGYSNQIPHSFPGQPQFPGDPDYPGSQMSSLFGGLTPKPTLFDFSQTPDSTRGTSWRSS